MTPPPSDQTDSTIKIMLVDDSAVVRGMLSRVLSSEPDFEIIKSVTDGEQALKAVETLSPDIILLDVEMPVMDGMTALPQLLEKAPNSKIVMCSTLTVRNASITLEALRIGATECIGKPTKPEDIKPGGDFQQSLVGIIRGLGPSKTETTEPEKSTSSIKLNTNVAAYTGKPSIIAIGSSTGGPQALFEVVSHFKDLDIPMILTQHMPATFTKILAQHISNNTGVTSIEAEQDMVIENGILYVAPGGYHMIVKKNADGALVAHIDDSPPINFCKPAVDPMFESAIDIFGNKVLGVILTGMGHDGLDSSKTLIKKGGRLIAQDEETSVVWGMPGAVANAGLCTEVLPLNQIGPWVRKAVTGI
ncbi:MAG: chemotaxis response regulator protein-glutamate methylesterase [Pseudomonadota bacterium]